MRNCSTTKALNGEEPSSPSKMENLKINNEDIQDENSSVSTKDNSEAVKNEIQNKRKGSVSEQNDKTIECSDDDLSDNSCDM